jgi:hypothetical protein
MSIEVPMHTVIKFTPVRGGGWSESLRPLNNPEGLAVMEHTDTIRSELSSSSLPSLASNTSPIWGDHHMASPRSRSWKAGAAAIAM